MVDRAKQSLQGGIVGGLAGYIAERGLESALGVDFINGVLEIAGATLGVAMANRDLVEQLYYAIKETTGKEPAHLNDEEWERVRAKYPRAVEYLEKALAIR